jgi:predicted transcriptional regulator of viral defense system
MSDVVARSVDSGEALRLIQSQARYVFDTEEFARVTGRNAHAARVSLARLARRKYVEVVHKRPSVWLIVPPEYSHYGAPPFAWWAHDCLTRLVPFYYVGLLSAARIWGSSHYALQVEQVVVQEQRGPIEAGRQKVVFVSKADAARTPVTDVARDRGRLRVSTREATLLDLVRHQDKIGGIEAIARIIKDFGPDMKPSSMLRALDAMGQVSVAQRLGFLLERMGLLQMADLVADWLGPRRVVRRTLSESDLGVDELLMDERWAVRYSGNQQRLLEELRQ